MKTVAIIGAGLCGLAMAVLCIQKGYSVHLYERSAIGGGASGVAAGLLHGYSGAHAKKNRFATDALAHTYQLLQLAEKYSKQSFYHQKGLYRLAFTEEQQIDFFNTATAHADVEWVENIQTILPQAPPVGAIYISQALAIHTQLYLKALWNFCEMEGGKFFVKEIEEPKHLKEDVIILTTGAALARYPQLKTTLVKGQLISLQWPEKEPPLPCPISSKVYIVMEGNHKCWVGGTFERTFVSEKPDPQTAFKLLAHAAEQLYPPLKAAPLLDCLAGVRVSTPNHLPIFGQLEKNIYYLGGMGSKGLLYHAYYANKLLELV